MNSLEKTDLCMKIHSKHNKQQEVSRSHIHHCKITSIAFQRFRQRTPDSIGGNLLGSFLKRFLPNHLDATFSFSFRGYINSNSGEEFVSMRHQPFNMSSPPPPCHRSSRLHSTMCRALFHVAYTSTLSCLLTLEQNEFRRVCWCTAPPPPPPGCPPR